MKNNYPTLGCFKSKSDKKDLIIMPFLSMEKLPVAFDRTKEMTLVRSQGNEGACVGFAFVVGCKEWQEKKDYNKAIKLSPRFLYEEAKKRSGHSEGTTLKAAVEVAKALGTCEDTEWPYYPKDTGRPSSIAYKEALKYRINGYARVTRLNELKQAIFELGPCIIGVKVYRGMISDGCKVSGVVPNVGWWEGLNPLGGHALSAVGYNDVSPYFKNDGHIKVKNSWGDFGDKGYLYLSYTYIKKHMMDAFSSVDNDDPLPYIKTVNDMNYWERKTSWV